MSSILKKIELNYGAQNWAQEPHGNNMGLLFSFNWALNLFHMLIVICLIPFHGLKTCLKKWKKHPEKITFRKSCMKSKLFIIIDYISLQFEFFLKTLIIEQMVAVRGKWMASSGLAIKNVLYHIFNPNRTGGGLT